MVGTIRCIHCRTRTTIVYKDIKSVLKNAVILLKAAPMHYCAKCDDTLIPIEVLSTFDYVKSLPLKPGICEYDFINMYEKVRK